MKQVQYRIQYSLQPEGVPQAGYIFVIGHMRSYSSLLCHILGSNPAISGYAETHQSYFGSTDLRRLARKVRETKGAERLGPYILDKMLHNGLAIAPNILQRSDIKIIFLIRPAEETI